MMTITGRHTVTMITTTVIQQLGKSDTTDLQYLKNGPEIIEFTSFKLGNSFE